MLRLSVMASIVVLCICCTPEPQQIHYGEDKCDYCRMTIVDPRFAAEAITPKGKVLKFDAIECMIDMKHAEEDGYFNRLFVNDYLGGKQFADASACTYLISEQIPSPMGKYLSAYLSESAANEMQQTHGGTVYSWDALLLRFTD